MTTAPLEAHPEPDDGIPAADAGADAPAPQKGFGVDGAEDPSGEHHDED